MSDCPSVADALVEDTIAAVPQVMGDASEASQHICCAMNSLMRVRAESATNSHSAPPVGQPHHLSGEEEEPTITESLDEELAHEHQSNL